MAWYCILVENCVLSAKKRQHVYEAATGVHYAPENCCFDAK